MLRLLASFLVISVLHPTSALIADETLVQRFNSEAPKGWSRIEKFMSSIEGRATMSQRTIVGATEPRTDLHEFQTSKGCEVYKVTDLETGLIYMNVVNNNYGFRAHKEKDAAAVLCLGLYLLRKEREAR